MTNFEMVKTMNTLNMFTEKRLPQKLSYAITKSLKNIYDEYSCYEQELNKIFSAYEKYLIKDKDGNTKFHPNGIPVVDKEHAEAFSTEITGLLNMEVDVKIFTVPSEIFNYEDTDRYDSLSVKEIIELESVLCKQ